MTLKMNNLNKSSVLMSKLESINWCFSMHTILNGLHSTLLVKYVIEDNCYAIMLSDFATTYFECSTGTQIDQHYQKYNKAKLTHENIVTCIQSMLNDLPNTVTNIEKLQVDCHTTRITLRCTKQVSNNFKFNWNFHIISTDQDIFLKHFSLPMFRGLMYYYNMFHSQRAALQGAGNNINNDETMNIKQEYPQDFPLIHEVSAERPLDCITDGLLNDIFRYETQSR